MRLISGAALVSLFALHAGDAFAQGKPPKPQQPPAQLPDPSPEEAKKQEAREIFERGFNHLAEEQYDVALADFQRSRAIYPTKNATRNAVVCLRKLRRYDEALEMLEAFTNEFSDFSADDRQFAQRVESELKAVVGFLDLRGAEPGAAVNVDGRDRGDFKPGAPLRVSAGTRLVRLYRSGFAPFEKRVDVSGEQTVAVDAKMVALTRSGRLKVTEEAGKPLDVVVDGVVVGKAPWEGDVGVGDHSVVLRGDGDLGTAPVSAPVRQNETTPLTLTAIDLDSSVRIEPTPAGATVALDGVLLGRGVWEGRLGSGDHQIEVGAEGFISARKPITLKRGARDVVVVKLERDPKSPIWGEQSKNRLVVELGGGAALAPSFGGDVAGCDAPCSTGLGVGVLAQLHVAYELEWGLMLGLSGGYLSASQDVTGRPSTVTPLGLPPEQGTVDDALRLSGLLIGAMAGWHGGKSFPVGTLRLGAGALIGSVADERHGAFKTQAGTAYEPNLSDAPGATYLYIAPEARLGARFFDRFELSVGAQGMILLGLSKPVSSATTTVKVPDNEGVADFGSNDEELAGTMFVIVPNATIRADFSL